MKTYKALQEGKLKNATHVKIACGLTDFPTELYALASTLEILDLTDNQLSSLPEEFSCFKKLKILFISNNLFTEVPPVLATLPTLTMLGMRNNTIETLAENTLPEQLRWLILTDNHLTTLPQSIGKLKQLQKCMLSGNQLTSLPKSMQACHNLELLRISVNQIATLPMWLFSLPKLTWLAYGGNPCSHAHPSKKNTLASVSWKHLTLKERLGEGASGTIYKALYGKKEVAVKVFKGNITSDGLPQDEIQINIALGRHPHLIDVLAKVTEHPQGNEVLMLELIPSHFYNLGLPPTLQTCTRDTYALPTPLSLEEVERILKGILLAAIHMHKNGIMHGDFYAHNIMIDKDANVILGDFGGATYCNPKEKALSVARERLEVRAFGILVEEMLALLPNTIESKTLTTLAQQCQNEQTEQRPTFEALLEYFD